MKKNYHIPSFADTILKEFITAIATIHPNFIKGIYLTGSITLNDYHPNKSDIDFLVLCDELPDKELRLKIETAHKEIEKKFNNSNLSGFYITNDALHVRHANKTKALRFHEGRMTVSGFEMAVITLYELKTTAITLHGIPVQDLPIIVEQKDVNEFLFENINSYWKAWIDKPTLFSPRKILILLFPRLTEWVVLGVARQFYTLQTRAITSKTNAGYYCLQHLPTLYHAIIKEAIQIRSHKRKLLFTFKSSYYLEPSLKRYQQTIACARYTIQLFNEEYKQKENALQR